MVTLFALLPSFLKTRALTRRLLYLAAIPRKSAGTLRPIKSMSRRTARSGQCSVLSFCLLARYVPVMKRRSSRPISFERLKFNQLHPQWKPMTSCVAIAGFPGSDERQDLAFSWSEAVNGLVFRDCVWCYRRLYLGSAPSDGLCTPNRLLETAAATKPAYAQEAARFFGSTGHEVTNPRYLSIGPGWNAACPNAREHVSRLGNLGDF